ncbi:uncharacterized protein [Clytia hemisphaerica]|uniref:uncharacterized protein isoform X2 n=1 Tax=Clytia hemisphaerica TaxID=252671 RepID=UPI0034D55C9E
MNCKIFEEDDDLSDASTLSDDASDFSEISVDELMELSDSTASGLRDPEVKGNVSAIGSSNSDRQTLKTGENHLLSHAEQHLNTTRINSQNVANIETVSQAAYKAGKTVLEQKSAMFENAPNFNALTRGQKNAIGGFTFENLSDGRVRSNMGVNGKPTGLIEGDGKGFVQTRTGECQTPEYTDTTFVTKKGPKVTQYKYTNDADQMQMVTERFFNRWSRRDDATIKSPNLPSDFHLENMEVYGPPDAVDGRTFEVKTGPNSRKQIQPKGEINIDGVKTELPNVADVDKYLQENFTKLKDMASDVNVLRQERAKMAALEKQLQTKQTRLNKVRIKNPDQTQTIKALQSQIDDKIKGINKARKELKKQERAFEKESRKLKTTDDLAKNKAKRQMIKGAALQVAVGALIDGATTLIISISEQLELYKKGEITLLQLVGNVTKQTAVAVVRGGGVAAAMVGAQLGLQQMALASNSVISGIGKFGSTTLGPALLIGGLSFQTYGILSSYNQGAITTGEMQRQFGRMAATTGLSIGAMATSMAVFGGAGPAGLLIGAGCCIVVALGDYFFGDKFMRLFFDDDPKEIKIKQIQRCKEFEEKVINKAYELFGLEDNCSDEELIEAKKAGYLKYHPDKCKGSEEEKRENTMKFQALLCAFTLLKVRRCMK